MTETVVEPNVDALLKAIAELDDEFFQAYRGGWPGQVSVALVDAVYSIQATYDSEHPERGVLNRVKKLRSQRPEVEDDLGALINLGEERLRDIMGNGKTSQRYKSECVIEAAHNFVALDPSVRSSADFTTERLGELQAAYVQVRGLGRVTFDYFVMNLGVPGIKADTLLTRFVARHAYGDENRKISTNEVVALVTKAWETDSRGAENLSHFEHALWLAESS